MADLATKEMHKRMTKILAVIVLIIGIVSSVIVWWFMSSRISLVTVQGESMEPTLSDGDTIILRQAKEIEKGMLVVFPKPDHWGNTDGKLEIIKRVAALEGSTVEYDGEALIVDGQEIYNLKQENYLCNLEPGYSYTLSANEIFALGDNHKRSLDSLRILCDAEDPQSAYVPLQENFAYGYQDGKL